MVEGGIFTILHNALQKLSKHIENKEIKVIALVHDASKFKNRQLFELVNIKFYALYTHPNI